VVLKSNIAQMHCRQSEPYKILGLGHSLNSLKTLYLTILKAIILKDCVTCGLLYQNGQSYGKSNVSIKRMAQIQNQIQHIKLLPKLMKMGSLSATKNSSLHRVQGALTNINSLSCSKLGVSTYLL
jgi:hypothetical protein